MSDGPSALPRLSPDHLLEQSRLLDKVEVESCSSGIKDSQLGQPAIRVPPNSLLWLKLVRSRFLLIQSCEMVLELWDLTTPAKCVGSCGVDGTVDGAVIEDEGDPYSTGIFVSTRYMTARIIYVNELTNRMALHSGRIQCIRFVLDTLASASLKLPALGSLHQSCFVGYLRLLMREALFLRRYTRKCGGWGHSSRITKMGLSWSWFGLWIPSLTYHGRTTRAKHRDL